MVQHRTCESNVAWALAQVARPHLDTINRGKVFVAIGAGDMFEVIRDLLRLLSSQNVSISEDLGRQCRAWLTGYTGCKGVRDLQGLVDRLASLDEPEPTITLRPNLRPAVTERVPNSEPKSFLRRPFRQNIPERYICEAAEMNEPTGGWCNRGSM